MPRKNLGFRLSSANVFLRQEKSPEQRQTRMCLNLRHKTTSLEWDQTALRRSQICKHTESKSKICQGGDSLPMPNIDGSNEETGKPACGQITEAHMSKKEPEAATGKNVGLPFRYAVQPSRHDL
ncbi:UNVERIFIED_CONTAM: hypothetical protein HHA_286465 [Hammondia hammondi]|eukprot:XP_008884112.1 hypothetical protein HHA_286465 [Hammondia hammondi]